MIRCFKNLEQKEYTLDNKYFAFFTCDDGYHYIYARDDDMKDVIECVDLDVFIEEVGAYADEYGQENLIWNGCANVAELYGMIIGAKYEALMLTETVGETLSLK